MTREQLEVLLIALAWAGGVALTGLVVVRAVRTRSVRAVLASGVLVSILSVVAGVLGTARAMFISGHDLGVVLPVTVVAGGVGLLVALVLAGGVVRDVDGVRAVARALGDGGTTDGTTDGGTRGSAGTTAGRSGIRELRDIEAELVLAGRRLAASRAREQALEASRRDLVAWVSHDLRTPLAGLRAMAEALEDGMSPDPARYHRQIRREVDRLSGMVDDLFELSRISSGALALSRADVDLAQLVDDVVAGSRPTARARGVVLAARTQEGRVHGDPAELSRVLANLVTNAIRSTPSDGTVRVEAGLDGDEAVLAVSDTCGGIAEHDLPRVFEAGWRGTPARTPVPDGGAGLGLAIARGIVEAHEGRISVRNAGAGCRFEVRLPLRATA